LQLANRVKRMALLVPASTLPKNIQFFMPSLVGQRPLQELDRKYELSEIRKTCQILHTKQRAWSS
jgi:hypothetical protein